jgi:hypothetical protein
LEHKSEIFEKIPVAARKTSPRCREGVDKIALFTPAQNKLKTKIFIPDYETFGKRAPLERNLSILSYADIFLPSGTKIRGHRFRDFRML